MNIFKISANAHVLIGMFILSSCDQGSNSISLQNRTNDTLNNKALVINRLAFDVSDEEYILISGQPQPSKGFKPLEGSSIPVQFDDLDQDGLWDEAVFLYDFLPNETIDLHFTKIKKDKLPVYPSKANVHLGYSRERNNKFASVSINKRPHDHVAQSSPYLYQYEGPAWESERVAFRLYFDSRNGKDIFGKTKSQLFADSIGLGENYHALQDWGMDILKVGASLGAGSLGFLKNDSLYRLTATRDQKFEIIADGPVRAIFKLTYKGWDVAGKKYDLEEVISIWGGKRWYESKVRLSGGTASDTLVTGIVDLKNASRVELGVNQWKIRYLHGKISENNDYLGMAVFIPDQNFAGFDEAPTEGQGILNTALAYLVPSYGIYKFAFYAGWEGENKAFRDEQYFKTALTKETTLLNKVVEIKINKNE